MKKMKYWTMNSAGRDKLSLQTQTLTAPGPNEVRVRVNAVALNYRDKLIIEGAMPAVFPLTPASDMAGVVEAVGDNVSQFTPGDRVISSFFPDWIEENALAAQVSLTAQHLVARIPECWRNRLWSTKTGWWLHQKASVMLKRVRCPVQG
jgi:NADPH:quinone reductase-like Zn-dependent oxidoreductase